MKLFQLFKTCLPMVLFVSLAANAEPVTFTVKNSTSAPLVALQISSNTHSWSAFSQVDVKAGQAAAFEWVPTPQSTCIQFIRGRFAEAGWSAPVKIDFCQDSAVNVVFK